MAQLTPEGSIETRAKGLSAISVAAGVALIATAVLPPINSRPSSLISIGGILGVVAVMAGSMALFVRNSSSAKGLVIAWLALLAAIMGLAGKAYSEASASTGFDACYQIQSPLNPDGQRTSACEEQFTWWAPTGATRLDEVIEFSGSQDQEASGIAGSSWFLPFINHAVYRYYDWDPTQPSRDRLPLNVYWAGSIDPGQIIDITYIGEGVVRTGEQTVFLEPAYAETNSVEISGTSDDLYIEFRWTGNAPPDSPFASIAVTNQDGTALRVAMPPGIQIALWLTVFGSLLASALIFVLAFWQMKFCQQRMRWSPRRWGKAALAALSTGTLASLLVPDLWIPAVLVATLLALLAATRILTDSRTARLVASATIPAVSLVSAFGFSSTGARTQVLRGGDDFLTYVSFARDILIQGSLRAGEDIFQYSPAIRYWLFAQFSLLGEDLRAVHALSLVLILTAIWFAFSRLVLKPAVLARGNPMVGTARLNILLALAIILLGLLVGGYTVWFGGLVLFAEYPTWPLIVVGLTLALTNRGKPSEIVALGLVAGLMIAFRNHQLPGALAITVLGVIVAFKAHPEIPPVRRWLRLSLLSLIPIVALSALTAMHNWHYGGRFVLRDPQQVGLTTVIPFTDLSRLVTTDAQTVLSQISGLLFMSYNQLGIPYDTSLSYSSELGLLSPTGIGIRAIQVLFVISAVWLMLNSATRKLSNVLLVSIPVLLLAPHFFLNVFTYYPRHIVGGYAAATVVLLAAAGWSLQPNSRDVSTGMTTDREIAGMRS